jgi:uncharacterized protein with FMN-binding domain
VNPEPPRPTRERTVSGGKITNRLVALGSAAVLAVYTAGYERTRPAANRIEAAERPRFVGHAAPVTPKRTAAPAPSIAPAIASAPTLERATIQAPAATPKSPSSPKSSQRASGKTASSGQPRRPQPAAHTAEAPAPVPAVTAAALVAAPAAEAASPEVEAPAAPPQAQYKDGTYSGWGTSRHGDIEATVVIDGGRIASAVISQCWTRYSCSCVAHLQGQVVARQSPEVDYVSGATQSVNAFYYAVVQALSKAK